MNPSRSTWALLLAALFVAGCDDGRVGRAPDDSDTGEPRGAYTREMIFVADDATGAALFDFSATDVGTAVRRRASAWAEAGSGWTALYDLAWDGSALRRPWRLVPEGPLRLRAGLNDEVEAIMVREGTDDIATLEHGDFVAAWTPHATAQVVLRQATLFLGPEPIDGWLVDARFGVTEAADAAQEDPSGTGTLMPNPTPAPAEEDEGEPAEPAEPGAAAEFAQEDSVVADSAPGETFDRSDAAPATMRIRSIRGVLVDDDGATLVIGQAGTGTTGWLYTQDGERTFPILTLSAGQGGRETWSVEAGGGASLRGTLVVMDEEPAPLSPRFVRGTVTVTGDALEMHGVLRAEPLP